MASNMSGALCIYSPDHGPARQRGYYTYRADSVTLDCQHQRRFHACPSRLSLDLSLFGQFTLTRKHGVVRTITTIAIQRDELLFVLCVYAPVKVHHCRWSAYVVQPTFSPFVPCALYNRWGKISNQELKTYLPSHYFTPCRMSVVLIGTGSKSREKRQHCSTFFHTRYNVEYLADCPKVYLIASEMRR